MEQDQLVDRHRGRRGIVGVRSRESGVGAGMEDRTFPGMRKELGYLGCR